MLFEESCLDVARGSVASVSPAIIRRNSLKVVHNYVLNMSNLYTTLGILDSKSRVLVGGSVCFFGGHEIKRGFQRVQKNHRSNEFNFAAT